MNVQSLKLVYFSPTKTTQRIVEEIATGLNIERTEVIDCTKPETRAQKAPAFFDELVILGAPVYGGRIPLEAAEYFHTLTAENTPAVVVVVYGNRHYDYALKELYDIAVDVGCTPVAGGIFIGEHSNSTEHVPIAHGRPDTADLQKAREFGAHIREKLDLLDHLDGLDALHVPGDNSYQKRRHIQKIMPNITPKTNATLCTRCGRCVQVCPTAAISKADVIRTDKHQCLLCHACIKTCPTGAREMKNLLVKLVSRGLSLFCQKRKEPEIYLE